MIKHVSFDVWNTLIRPNPQFAEVRLRFLSIALNMDLAHVKLCYTKIKQIADGSAEQHGIAFSSDELYSLLYKAIGVSVSPGLHREIRLTIDQLFHSRPPTIGANVDQLMAWLRTRNITTSIGSNSNFISGSVMRPFLEQTLNHQFLAAVFSDLDQVAKPIGKFFDMIMDQVNVVRDIPIDRSEILHVGDSTVCDVLGAQNAGMCGLLIESPDMLHNLVQLRIESDREVINPYVLSIDQQRALTRAMFKSVRILD